MCQHTYKGHFYESPSGYPRTVNLEILKNEQGSDQNQPRFELKKQVSVD